MANKNVYQISFILLSINVMGRYHCQGSDELMNYSLNDAHKRHARLRCSQQYPQADTVSFKDTAQTHCFLQCYIYALGLMDLKTRGLSESFKEYASGEDDCVLYFDFFEPLSGKCSDYYRKLMELRWKCGELFQYIFSSKSIENSINFENSKRLGQSATDFCDLIDEGYLEAGETSVDEEASLLWQHKNKLTCVFENIYYLDAYGRVNEFEINLSYQEADEDSLAARAIIKTCSHFANAKYKPDYLGDLVLELQKCLKDHSPVYDKVFRLRDETSRNY